MKGDGARRLRSWLLFLAGFGFVIATLELAYETSLFLRSRGFLWDTVKLMTGGVSVVVVYLLVIHARVNRPMPYIRSIPALALFIYAMLEVRSSPSERFHFVEYGILYLLALRAAAIDVRGYLAYVVALVVTAGAGWLDEWIQGLSTVRYYDFEDIKMNALAAALAGLLLLSLFGKHVELSRFDLGRVAGSARQATPDHVS